MPRFLPPLFGALIAGLIVVAPLVYSSRRHAARRHLHVVEEGVLYRSGQLTLEGLKQIIHEYGIKTVVSLRDRDPAKGDREPPDIEEEKYCRSQELNYLRISPRPWWASDGSVPAAKGVKQFLDVMRDPANYPVLIHCFAGIHRTGAFCAVYRMEFDRLDNARAIAEVIAHGYTNLNEEIDLLTFLENYRPGWREMARAGEE